MIETLTECPFGGCDRPSFRGGLCRSHRHQLWRSGTLMPLRKWHDKELRKNPDMPGSLLVPLTMGMFAIIDEADGDVVGRHRWHTVKKNGTGCTEYAATNVRGGHPVRLHQFLWTHWGLPPVPEIDHENTNGLDCRRRNLRAATRQQNARNRPLASNNTSGKKGVRLRPSGKWEAYFSGKNGFRFLGTFETREDAARAYNAATREAFGSFANLNPVSP